MLSLCGPPRGSRLKRVHSKKKHIEWEYVGPAGMGVRADSVSSFISQTDNLAASMGARVDSGTVHTTMSLTCELGDRSVDRTST